MACVPTPSAAVENDAVPPAIGTPAASTVAGDAHVPPLMNMTRPVLGVSANSPSVAMRDGTVTVAVMVTLAPNVDGRGLISIDVSVASASPSEYGTLVTRKSSDPQHLTLRSSMIAQVKRVPASTKRYVPLDGCVSPELPSPQQN